MSAFSSEDLKIILDIGLGATSIMLWLGQGKVNRKQAELDETQSKMTKDLTEIVDNHGKRITRLESKIRLPKKGKP